MTTKAQLEARRAIIREEKSYLTSRMSESCRYVGFGLLAIFYTIRSAGADNTFAQSLMSDHAAVVFLVGAFGAITILLDYLQYFFGQHSAVVALKSHDALYNPASLSYQGRMFCYATKQITVAVGSALLVVLVLIA